MLHRYFDRTHPRNPYVQFLLPFTRREIKLMTGQHISLVLIDDFTINKPIINVSL